MSDFFELNKRVNRLEDHLNLWEAVGREVYAIYHSLLQERFFTTSGGFDMAMTKLKGMVEDDYDTNKLRQASSMSWSIFDVKGEIEEGKQ